MIELGRRDLFQQISGFDLAADIDVALGDVARLRSMSSRIAPRRRGRVPFAEKSNA
jgi:hypothetical protein